MSNYVSDDEIVYMLRRGDHDASNYFRERFVGFIKAKMNFYPITYKDYDYVVETSLANLINSICNYDPEKSNFYKYALQAIVRIVKTIAYKMINDYTFEINNEDREFVFEEEEEVQYDLDDYPLEEIERKIVELRIEEKSYKYISEVLGISEKKVDNIIQRIKRTYKNGV